MSDDAEEAFDLLRGEVTLLRRAVEGLLADPVKIPPEVSRQLRVQSAELKRLAEETQKISESPQLSLTPEAFPEYVRRTSASVTDRLEAPWKKTLADLQNVGAEFARYGERARLQDDQHQQIILASFAGGAAALVVWVGLSGPVARALPERWQIPERMAAATLDLGRLHAGRRLIASADPDGWSAIQRARDLVGENEETLDRCVNRPARQRASPCPLKIPRSWFDPGA